MKSVPPPASRRAAGGDYLPAERGREAPARPGLCAPQTHLAAYLRRKDGTSRRRGPAGAGGSGTAACIGADYGISAAQTGGWRMYGGCEGAGPGRRGGSPGRPRPA